MVEANIWKVFQATNVEFDIDVEPYRLRLDGEKLRRSQSFEEL
jgi:hypothetical protein